MLSRFLAAVESLETRNLLSTIIGQVITDANGNGLRDIGDSGVSGVTIELDQLNTSTGAKTLVTTTTSDSGGVYQFNGLNPGTYVVSEQMPTNTVQTFPISEHVAQSYVVQLVAGQSVAGGTLSSPMAPPAANWLASLPASTYSFPLAGDFMFQFGPSGVAPSRVFFTGEAQVQTQAPVVSTSTSGDGTTTTNITVNTTMTSLKLVGTIQSDQHEQGYLGTITMTLTAPSTGQITSRSDSNTLVDSGFDINATIQIPSAFGTPTVLHSAVPINFLAREIGQFPALGGVYQHNGTQPPISFVDSNNQEQGQLFFGSLVPLAGYDFGNFQQASIQGRAYIDANGDGQYDAGDTPLVNQPITLLLAPEIAGPSGEEGGDSEEGEGSGGNGGSSGGSGSQGPPVGHGPTGTVPVTLYTDSNGLYQFTNLVPGAYTLEQPVADPLTLVSPNNPDLQGYSIDTMTSGASLNYDFVNTFATGKINQSTAPDYPLATHTIVPNLHLGATEFANTGNQAYINDGVSFGSTLVPGAVVPVTITVVVPEGQTAYLSGWLDSHGNKSFGAGNGPGNSGDEIELSGDPNYAYLANYEVGPGVHTLALKMVVPSGASLTNGKLATFARFRLSTTPNLGPDSSGEGATPPDGEVEDVPVTIYDHSQLGTINGQTFEDANGNGVLDGTEAGQDGWTVNLVNLDTGQVVDTQTSAAEKIDLGNGTIVTEHGIYQFANVIPGRYEVQATPPADPSTPILTLPSSEESATNYRFQVSAGQTIGSTPYYTQQASTGWLNDLTAGTDSLFTLGQFMILKGGGSGHADGSEESGSGGTGETGSGGTDTNQPIRLSVIGTTKIYHGTIGTGGLLPAEITGLQLQGLAVTQSEEGGPITILGPVTVTLGMFPSTGTIGPAGQGSTGEDSTGDVGSFTLYASFDLTALGYGVVINTRPLNLSGPVTEMPMVDTLLSRTGGGSPIPLRSEATGLEPLRLVTASLTTMSGLNEGDFYPGSIQGTVYEDTNNDNVRQSTEAGLAGAVVKVQAVSEEGSSGEEGGEEGNGGESGNGGGSGNGSGESGESAPAVYLTQTDDQGHWTIGDLGPGTYVVTETPPSGYGLSGGTSSTYTITVNSRGQIDSLDFGNYPINDAPTIAAPTSANTLEDTALAFSAGSGKGISIADSDAGTNPVEVTLTSTGGTLTLAQTTGLTFVKGSASGASQIVVDGTVADIDAALAGLSFQPTFNSNGAASLAIGVNDLGNSGIGGPMTASASIPIDVAAVADTPMLGLFPAQGTDGNPIPLRINACRPYWPGTETISVTISGVPADAKLSAGTNLGGGAWQLTRDQLSGLTFTTATSGVYPLTVKATATEPSNGSAASTAQTLLVTVRNVVPTMTAPGNQSATLGQATTIKLGSFQDLTSDGAWKVNVNWGDWTAPTTFTQATTGQLEAMPHAYATSGQYVVTVSVQDRDGGTSYNQFRVTVAPPEIANIVINDGSAQRSMVKSIAVAFSGPEVVLPGAFVLRDQAGRVVNTNVATTQVGLRTVAILTFRGSSIVGGSLADGLYTLSIDGRRIRDGFTGGPTDAAHNGVAGSRGTFAFRRQFGDINGDGLVNRLDYLQFRAAYGSRAGQPAYRAAFDYNSDQQINATDQTQFTSRLRLV